MLPPEMADFERRLKDTLSTAYEIERELGGGGMSRVFVATDRILGRKIVIKVLSPELTAEVNRGRFRREIQVAAQLQHPHIVPLLSAGEQDDLLYFTMPFIKGESLKTAIEKDGRMSVNEVVRVVYHVGEALDYAHEAGIVHRDIKPANILRSGSYALITDFGVAKALNAAMPSQGMTSTGMAIGTPAYMAPEQLAGDSAADHRIDIYAVGLLAYELLNGKSPFAGTTPQRILAAVLTQEPRPLAEVQPDVPESLSNVVMRCLSKEPDNRPATAKELLMSLDMFANSSGEIRTMEHRVARIVRTPTPDSSAPPVAVNDDTLTPSERVPTSEIPYVPSLESTMADERIATPSHAQPAADGDWPSYSDNDGESRAPKKKRTKTLIGALAFLIPVVAGAVYLSKTGGAASPTPAAPATDSVAAVSAVPAVEPPLIAAAESTTTVAAAAAAPAAASVDSQRVADSVKKARRDAAKKAIAAAESLRKAREVATVQTGSLANARKAAAALIGQPVAFKQFVRGASHKGPLGQKRGDLQTQIDALTPFLAQAGLTYERFKLIAANAGAALFDENGRIIPAALEQFAAGH